MRRLRREDGSDSLKRPRMRGAPQVGFSRHMLRMRSRTSRGRAGLPGWPHRIFHAQNRRKLLRCQAMTVSG